MLLQNPRSQDVFFICPISHVKKLKICGCFGPGDTWMQTELMFFDRTNEGISVSNDLLWSTRTRPWQYIPRSINNWLYVSGRKTSRGSIAPIMFDNLVCLTTTLPTTKLVNNLALILLVLNPDRMVQKFEEVFFYEPKFVNNWFWNSVVEENIPPNNIFIQPSKWP